MIRAFLLILDSKASWEKIAHARRGFFFVFLVHLLPLMVITLGLEAYALMHLGERRGLTDQYSKIPEVLALRYGLAGLGLNLLVIFFGARLVQIIANNFHGQHTYLQCFSVLAYGLSPIFLGHVLDAAPFLNTWVCFGIGMTLSAAVLYQGVPLILRPDHAKALGLYFVVVLLISALAAMAHLFSLLVLRGELTMEFFQKIVKAFGL